MKLNTLLAGVAVAIAASTAAVSASAAVLYDGGAVNGTIGGRTIGYYNYMVADSFSLAAKSVVDGVTFGSWTTGGDLLNTIDWAVLDGAMSAGGNVIASGTAAPSHSALLSGGWGYYNVRDEAFSIAPLTLNAGTYWLRLSNGATQNNRPVYWDINYGPSIAEQHSGYGQGTYRTESNSFQVLGGAGVPEPAAWALMLTGFFGAGVMLRNRRAALAVAG